MDQILAVLDLIQQRLNTHLQNLDPRTDDWVVLSNVADQEGRSIEPAKDKVALVLTNITFDTNARSLAARAERGVPIVPPALHVDLSVLIFANFSGENYRAGLQAIGRAISFFHQNPVFTLSNTLGLDPPIDTLTIEPANLALAELRDLVALLGVKYLPCAAYRIRTIPFGGNAEKTPAAKPR